MLLDSKPYPLVGMENPYGRPEYRGHALEKNVKAIRNSSEGKENGKIVLPKIKIRHSYRIS